MTEVSNLMWVYMILKMVKMCVQRFNQEAQSTPLQTAQSRRIEMADVHRNSDMCGTLAGLSAFATAL